MENRPLFEAPFEPDFYGAAKELLRSTHSAGQARERLTALVRGPSRRRARRVAGALAHRARLPWVAWRTRRLAVENPRAVLRKC